MKDIVLMFMCIVAYIASLYSTQDYVNSLFAYVVVERGWTLIECINNTNKTK